MFYIYKILNHLYDLGNGIELTGTKTDRGPPESAKVQQDR
jgi:hypothetical protein